MAIVIIAGTIASGKTYTIQLMQEQFKNYNIFFGVEEDYSLVKLNRRYYNCLDEFYKEGSGSDAKISTQMIISLKELKKWENILKLTPHYDLIILDRWYQNCHSFIEYTKEVYDISRFSADFLHNFLSTRAALIHQHMKTPMVPIYVFVLDTPENTCVERIFQRGRLEECSLSSDKWLEITRKLKRLILEKEGARGEVCSSQEEIVDKVKQLLPSSPTDDQEVVFLSPD